MRKPSPFTTASVRSIEQWIKSRPPIFIGRSPAEVLKQAWGQSQIEIGLPQWIDQLHMLGVRPVELSAVPDPHGSSRDYMSQWQLSVGLQIVGGLDHGEDKS